MALRATLVPALLLASLLLAMPAAAQTVCLSSLEVTLDDDGEATPFYHWKVVSTHLCGGVASGVLIVFFDSEAIFVGDCSGLLTCSITLEGDAQDWDCFRATAFANGGVLDVPGSSGNQCKP